MYYSVTDNDGVRVPFQSKKNLQHSRAIEDEARKHNVVDADDDIVLAQRITEVEYQQLEV